MRNPWNREKSYKLHRKKKKMKIYSTDLNVTTQP